MAVHLREDPELATEMSNRLVIYDAVVGAGSRVVRHGARVAIDGLRPRGQVPVLMRGWFSQGRRSGLASGGAAYFHAVERELTRGDDLGISPHNDLGGLAWGAAWRMLAYLMMAEATGDASYTLRLARLIDLVLDRRDNARGVADHRGRSGPVWSSSGKFALACASIPDLDGRPVAEVWICPPHERVVVDVHDDGTGQTGMRVSAPGREIVRFESARLDDVVMRIDRVAYRRYDQRTGVSIALDHLAEPGRLRPGRYPAIAQRVTHAAQTGPLVRPIAGLARLALHRPELVPHEVLDRLSEYVEAACAALAWHDAQWQDSAHEGGQYYWHADEPVSFAASALPINESLTLGLAAIDLSIATGEPRFARIAEGLARALRAELVVSRDTVRWSYWPRTSSVYQGWTATGAPQADPSPYRASCAPVRRAEDVTHALIDIEFIHRYATNPAFPRVFEDELLHALARTFTHRIAVGVRRIGIRQQVVAASPRAPAHRQPFAAAWLPLRQWSPAVVDVVAAAFPTVPPNPSRPVDAYCGALLARWG